MGPGTLYGALGKLEKQMMISNATIDQKDSRKYYRLTALGKELLQLEFRRLESLVKNTKNIILELEGEQDDH